MAKGVFTTRLYKRLQEHRGEEKLKFLVATQEEAQELYDVAMSRQTRHGDTTPRPDSDILTLFGTEIRREDGSPYTYGDVRGWEE